MPLSYHAYMTATPPGYRGRFAPTPSGPLHLGSLLTAVLSYLDARAAHGEWLLRVDDLDRERCSPAHADHILRQLEAHGLHWDGAPRYQSAAVADYAEALATLRARDRIYGCDCSRKRLRAEPATGSWGPVYGARCRTRGLLRDDAGNRLALRLLAPEGPVRLHDDWRDPLTGDWQSDVGDCVLRRRDGSFGYALASAVDEYVMGVTHVVRGADLLIPTLAHFAVLDALGWPRPNIRHGPLLQCADGAKLSKQNHATPIADDAAGGALLRCCHWLGVAPAGADPEDAPEHILEGATALWRERRASAPPAVIILDGDRMADSHANVAPNL